MIYDQLKGYCPCVEDISEDDVAEMVNVISMATGWLREPCETFLTSKRREVIDLPSCADCPITFTPYYRPYVPESFKFFLVKIEGVEEEVTEITSFRYSNVDFLFRVDTGLPSCTCACDPCGCPPEYRMVIEYVAGYDEIPDCLLPVFCHVLELIKAKNTCDCCNDCGCDTPDKEEEYPAGDLVSSALEIDIGKLLVEQYKNQLGMLSLIKLSVPLWGIVV